MLGGVSARNEVDSRGQFAPRKTTKGDKMGNYDLYVDSTDAANGNFYVRSVSGGVMAICSSLDAANALVAGAGAGAP